MTAEQKEMLLQLIKKESDRNYPDGNYDEWNKIYWQIVLIETK